MKFMTEVNTPAPKSLGLLVAFWDVDEEPEPEDDWDRRSERLKRSLDIGDNMVKRFLLISNTNLLILKGFWVAFINLFLLFV